MNTKCLIFIFILITYVSILPAQNPEGVKSFEIYGLVMTDAGYNANQIDPDWFDVIRCSKLPSYKNEFGSDGNVFFSIRQSTFGVKSYYQTSLGELKSIFEFDLFGTGKNTGQTTFHFRKAYFELGHFGAGQHWSLFSDIDVFPNTLEYWGPVGMALLPNIQITWIPIIGDTRLRFALERPGASADKGAYEERIELDSVRSHLPLPDFTAEYRKAGKFGYVELAGVIRYMEWEDLKNHTYDLSGSAIGWGLSLSSLLNFTKKLSGHFKIVYGEGIENYMNDAPYDIGIKNNFSDSLKPLIGVPLPIMGITAFIDVKWSEKFSSSVGYSTALITNSDGQKPDAFKKGQYALANLLYYPAPRIMVGIEAQYATRENYLDSWNTSIFKVQMSFRYKFLQEFSKK